MGLANQSQLEDKQKTERRAVGIPDTIGVDEFTPERFGPCHFCGITVSDFNWCYGCNDFICHICDINVNLVKGHTIQDHRRITQVPTLD